MLIYGILHRLDDRFPRRVLLWPVAVQGEHAAAEIAHAIEGFNRMEAGGPAPRPELLIVARGGANPDDRPELELLVDLLLNGMRRI